jgi:hypothetical protein
MDRQNFNIMFDSAVTDLTLYDVSESGAFPSVREVREMPSGQQRLVDKQFTNARSKA